MRVHARRKQHKPPSLIVCLWLSLGAVLTWPMPPKRHPQGAYKDRTVYDQDYSWPSTAEVVEVQPHRRARPPCMPGCYDGDRLYRLEL